MDLHDLQHQDSSTAGKLERKTRTRRQRIGFGWQLALQTRSGKARGFLRFWPLWERFTMRLWRLQGVPGTTRGLLMLQFTRYRGEPIDLPNGIHVVPGDRVGILHFRNQTLIQATQQLSSWEVLKWMAEEMRGLAAWLQTAEKADLKAIYGVTLLSRAAPRLGFTLRPRPGSVHAWFDRFFMMGLLVLYHEQGLERLTQGTTYSTYPQEAWMSLSELMQRYGPREKSPPVQ